MTSELSSRPDPTSPAQLRAMLRRYGFRPRRSLGQTFLVDGNIVGKIIAAAGLTGEESVVEIGAGAGAVTRALAEAAARVVAVEIDPVLVAVLGETVGDAVQVVQADVLQLDWSQLLTPADAGPWQVVANLPYAITGPAVLKLLAAGGRLDRITVMVQAEVAERLLAPPGTRTRGLLSVLVQAACEARSERRVPATCFWPRPRVDSTLLTLRVRRPPVVPTSLEPVFSRVVRAAFHTRRKTLANALSGYPELGLSKQAAADLLVRAGMEPGRRAETVSEEEFLRLAGTFAQDEEEGP